MSNHEISLIVDTNKYSGNFEREMTAYMTGHIGDCEVGESDADEYVSDLERDGLDPELYIDCVTSRMCDDGCHRPCEIHHDENGQYNAVEIFLSSDTSDEFFEFVKARAYEFGKKNEIKILGFRLKKTEIINTYTVI